MLYPLLTLLLLLLCAVWWWYRRGSRGRLLMAVEGKMPSYRCVEITAPDSACNAAKKLRERLFLSGEAPLLPLPLCRASKCDCRYRHHEDRRQDMRRNPYGRLRSIPPRDVGADRRSGGDRRAKVARG